MFTLLLILLILGITLGVGLFVAGLFVQGYIYTEPSPHLTWGAPVAAAVLFFFFSLWSLLVVFSGSTPTDIPYDAVHRFSPTVDRFTKPAKELWAVRKGGKTEQYKLHKYSPSPGQSRYDYRNVRDGKPWNGDDVETIVLKEEGQDLRFERVPEKKREQGAYTQFISSDGWVMTVYDDGPSGSPSKFRFGRFVVNLFLNFLHLGLWFVCLWLLMRFEWFHALIGAFFLWLACTLIILPMLLSYAAEVSQARQVAAPAASMRNGDWGML